MGISNVEGVYANCGERQAAHLPEYSVITPVKDEAKHFERTAESLLAQTYPPRQWVIVDDGSTDDTYEIASWYAAKHSWIRVIRAQTTGRRARGAPVVRAFNEGLAHLDARTDVVVKLDGDLFLPPYCFAWIATTFRVDPRAGVVGGLVFFDDGGDWVGERITRRVVAGALKAYRRECLDEIGGLHEAMGWDGIDEFGARACGWNVRVLSELHILHYKVRGSAQPWYRSRWEEGRAMQYMGYRPASAVLRAGYRMLVEPPPIAGGLLLGLAFCWYSAIGAPQADSRARRQLRSEQRGGLRRRARGLGDASSPALPDGGPAYWLTGREGGFLAADCASCPPDHSE